MKRVVLRFRAIDRPIFGSIKNGSKNVETRAATMKYHYLQPGDALLMLCGSDLVEKRIKKSLHFASVDQMLKQVDFKRILPSGRSVNDIQEIYSSFPGYKEKVRKFGLMAFEI